jgi:hypothetical protein
MRFVAIDLRSYDTWRMRLILTMLVLFAAACLPGRAAAFDLEESLRQQHVQYVADDTLRTVQGGMSLQEAIRSIHLNAGDKVISAETRIEGGHEVHYIKVLTKDGKVKTHKVSGR